MSKILVTGGAGFIGSHIAECLLDRGHEVTVLDDLSGGFEENIVPGVKFVQASICDHSAVHRLFEKEQFEYVYHLAAYAAENLSHFIKRFNYTNNLIGSVNLINASVNTGVKCFVFTSSIAVYGSAPELPMREDGPAAPEDSYGIAKLAVEMELRASREMFGLEYIVFRPHNVYGERQNIGDKYRNVVGIFMNQILQDKPMSVFGDGEQTRAFSHISDVAPLMADAIGVKQAYGETFNIGADRASTVKELAYAVAQAMGVQPKIEYLPAREEVFEAVADHQKARRIFGRHSSCELEDGLQRMASWVKKQGARSSQSFKCIEVTKNFPLAWST